MRIFLDTNVLASAIATRGLCADLFELVLAEHDLLTCHAVLDELKRVLTGKFRIPIDVAQAYVEIIEENAECITKADTILTPIPDPDDIVILGAALAGQAACFVTGDKALLNVGSVDAIPILSPRRFWEHCQLGHPASGD